jgi:predicted RNA binding protein YcfA (HicA-like mRNA interferase family)
MKQSPIHRREFIKRLKKLGWDGPHSGGKHQYMHKGFGREAFKLPIPNPHGSGELSVPLLRKLLNEAEISLEEWLNA